MMKMSKSFPISGKSQAENEQDPAAISALRKCLSLEPSNGAAWMALSVCLTNESYQAQACHALAMWIQTHPQYSALLPATLHSPTPENFRFVMIMMMSMIDNDLQVHLELHVFGAPRGDSGPVPEGSQDPRHDTRELHTGPGCSG